MIVSISYGSTKGGIDYIRGPAKDWNTGKAIPGTEERATLLGGSNFGFAVETKEDVRLALDRMRRDVELQASNTRPVREPFMHASFSWPPGYKPSRQEMLEAPEHFAKAWGMEGARRLDYHHNDREHDHVHSWFGRVNPQTGRAYERFEQMDKALHAARVWEHERGQVTPGTQRFHEQYLAARGQPDRDKLRDTLGGEPIQKRHLDRALVYGGHFGDERKALHKEFIEHHDLTRFPAKRQSYSSPELAKEKAAYIKEHKRAVRGLVDAYGFEKTAKPRVSRETQQEPPVGIFKFFKAYDDFWKRADEKWDGIRKIASGKEPEHKPIEPKQFLQEYDKWREGRGEDPMKKVFPAREPQRAIEKPKERPFDHESWKIQREMSDPRAAEQPAKQPAKRWRAIDPREERLDRLTAQAFEGSDRFTKIDPKAEEARIANWKTQRERHQKEEQRESPIRSAPDRLRGKRDEPPSWHKEEKRMDDARRQRYARDVRDIETERATSPRLPYRPAQSQQRDESMRELPAPKRESDKDRGRGR